MQGSFDTAVIGGGASGIISAISAARSGKGVVICERMHQCGKKILASGNGRCNLLNERLDPSYYNPASRPLVRSVFNRFNKDGIKDFFRFLGLELYSEPDGRVFPATNQAASVMRILEIEMRRLSTPVELSFDTANISDSKGGFTVASKSGKKIFCGSLILAGGGRSYPALGADGSAYRLAAHFGHKIIEPIPAAVPLTAKDAMCHILQGQKIFANAIAMIDGKPASAASGDLLFTKYGLSGTAILDISDCMSVALNRHHEKDAAVAVDLVPFMDEEVLVAEIAKRIEKGWQAQDMLAGILPNKFGLALKDLLATKDAMKIARGLKNRRFDITGTRGWNEAEFTAGGIDTDEVKESTLESKLKKGLYFAGEILDVNGARGGYNLAWAWASGFVAGMLG